MTAFLAELGTKLADRWITAVLSPGLLLITAATIAARLGQWHALDTNRLSEWITAVAASPASHSPGALLLATVGTLAGSVTAGLAAAGLGRLAERCWTLPGRRGLTGALARSRQRRWAAASDRVRLAIEAAGRAAAQSSGPGSPVSVQAPPAARTIRVPHRRLTYDLADALARRDAICLVEPERPTWIGDRMRAVDARVHRAYDIDLQSAWPRLWTLIPDALRTDLSAAQDAYATAARLIGWAVLYAAVAFWWWPAALVAICVAAAGWSKSRAAADVLACLVETAVDLYGRALATQLGIDCRGPLIPEVGTEITALLRKDEPGNSIGASPKSGKAPSRP